MSLKVNTRVTNAEFGRHVGGLDTLQGAIIFGKSCLIVAFSGMLVINLMEVVDLHKKGVDMATKKTSKKPSGKKQRRPPKKNGGRRSSPKSHRRLPGDLTTDAPPPKPKPDEDN